jgi:hypothetical protein
MTDIKERTKLKDKLAKKALEDAMDAPIESDGWINLDFDKSGRSFTLNKQHPSEKVAKDLSDNEWCDLENKFLTRGDFWITYHGVRGFKFSEYSHTIQMPVKD